MRIWFAAPYSLFSGKTMNQQILINRISQVNSHWLGVLCAVISLCLHLLYLYENDLAENLNSAYTQSDAFYYFYQAWYSVAFDPQGGMIGEIISSSPFIFGLTWFFKVFGFGLLQVFLYCALCTFITVYLLVLLTHELFEDQATSLIAGLLGAFSGVLIFYSGLLFKTSLVVCLIVALVYFAVLAIRRDDTRWLTLALLFCAIASLDRENIVLVMPVIIWFFVNNRYGRFSAPTRLFLSLAGTVVFLAGARILLSQIFGSDGIGNSASVNFMTANAPGADGNYSQFHDFENNIIGHRLGIYNHLCDLNGGTKPSFVQFHTVYLGEWIRYYMKYPLDLLVLKLDHLGIFISRYGLGHPEQFGLWRSSYWSLQLAFVDWSMVFSLALVGVGCNSIEAKSTLGFKLLKSILAIYFMGLMVFLPAERYRLVLYVLLIPIAARQLQLLFNLSKQKRELILCLILFGLSFSMVRMSVLASQLDPENKIAEIKYKADTKKYYQIMHDYYHSRSINNEFKVAQMMLELGMYYDAQMVAERLAVNKKEISSRRLQALSELIEIELRSSKRILPNDYCSKEI